MCQIWCIFKKKWLIFFLKNEALRNESVKVLLRQIMLILIVISEFTSAKSFMIKRHCSKVMIISSAIHYFYISLNTPMSLRHLLYFFNFKISSQQHSYTALDIVFFSDIPPLRVLHLKHTVNALSCQYCIMKVVSR